MEEIKHSWDDSFPDSGEDFDEGEDEEEEEDDAMGVEMNVNFDAQTATDTDFHGIKRLLQQLFLKVSRLNNATVINLRIFFICRLVSASSFPYSFPF